MYSQNDEESFIVNYFKNKKQNGYTCLSLGENDGQTLSNVRQFILNGNKGDMVEPAPTTFVKLSELYKDNDKVKCHQVAVADFNGEATFYNSGTHLNKGDTELLSTLDIESRKRWTKEKFEEIRVNCVTFDNLLSMCKYKKFHLISIDCENYDWKILQQMDLKKLGCEFLVVENNHGEEKKYVDYCAQFGLKLINKNYENLLFAKD